MKNAEKMRQHKALKQDILEKTGCSISTRLLNILLTERMTSSDSIRKNFETWNEAQWLVLPNMGQFTYRELKRLFGTDPATDQQEAPAAMCPEDMEKRAEYLGTIMARAFARELLDMTRSGTLDPAQIR